MFLLKFNFNAGSMGVHNSKTAYCIPKLKFWSNTTCHVLRGKPGHSISILHYSNHHVFEYEQVKPPPPTIRQTKPHVRQVEIATTYTET